MHIGLNKKNNFFYLFSSLVFMLLSSSIVVQMGEKAHYAIFDLLTVSMLLISLKSLQNDKVWFWVVGVLVFTSIIFFITNQFFISNYYEIITLFILLVFFVGSFKSSVKDIFASEEVNQNMIVGSIVLYLLLGLIFTTIYLFMLYILPNSFHGIEYSSLIENFSSMTYFSFVTLTTLGYGDIYPQEPIAKFFVATEAIIGVFYIAIIVASLVSTRLHSISKNR